MTRLWGWVDSTRTLMNFLFNQDGNPVDGGLFVQNINSLETLLYSLVERIGLVQEYPETQM